MRFTNSLQIKTYHKSAPGFSNNIIRGTELNKVSSLITSRHLLERTKEKSSAKSHREKASPFCINQPTMIQEENKTEGTNHKYEIKTPGLPFVLESSVLPFSTRSLSSSKEL